MVTTRKQTTKTASLPSKTRANSASENGKSANNKTSKEMTPEALAQRIQTAIERCYKVHLSDRQKRTETKVGYAVREKLGLDVLAQLRKQGKYNNGNTAKFWREFNSTVFPKLLGEPTELKYSVEIVAEAMALLYDSISSEHPIEDLIDFNSQSLSRRNGNNSEEKVADIDDLEEEFDTEDEEIDDLLEEASEEDEDGEEFELDDED